MVGGGNATEQDVVQVLTDSAWHVVGHLPTTRSDLSVVEWRGRSFVIGGYDGVHVPTAILELRPGGSTRGAGSLAQGVRYAATARAGHTAYVFGGEVLGRELDAVQAVDLRTGATRVVARLPVPLGHAMAATVGSRILLMGGRVTPDRQTDAMWWFDPASGSVHPGVDAPAPAQRCRGRVVRPPGVAARGRGPHGHRPGRHGGRPVNVVPNRRARCWNDPTLG